MSDEVKRRGGEETRRQGGAGIAQMTMRGQPPVRLRLNAARVASLARRGARGCTAGAAHAGDRQGVLQP
jgi:hypothetical protein